MSKPNNGGPAFPCEWDYIDSTREAANGMTLRDYFAAKAMQAFLVNARLPGLDKGDPEAIAAVEFLGRASYLIADAMLKARNA